VLRRHVAGGAALVPSVLYVLPAVGAVAVECNDHVVLLRGVERLGQHLHVALLRAIHGGLERNVLRLAQRAGPACRQRREESRDDDKTGSHDMRPPLRGPVRADSIAPRVRPIKSA